MKPMAKKTQELMSVSASGAVSRRCRNLAKVGEGQVECCRKREVGQERQQADQLQKIVAAIDQPDQHHSPEKAGEDI
jgi:hypothetical protein